MASSFKHLRDFIQKQMRMSHIYQPVMIKKLLNKQLAFVEHVVRGLKPRGRAAMVPDNVLFEENAGRPLRIWLMDLCNLHTILRMPSNIHMRAPHSQRLHEVERITISYRQRPDLGSLGFCPRLFEHLGQALIALRERQYTLTVSWLVQKPRRRARQGGKNGQVEIT